MTVTSEQVKSLALSLGFDACGIVSAAAAHEDLQPFTEWLAKDFHGEMKYLEDFESRARKFWDGFPAAKSIIVVGVNYYSETAKGARPLSEKVKRGLAPFGLGRVARYAWGKDYHRVIVKRLEEFRDRLEELVQRKIRAEICVDTKPLRERSLAQKAGLGFIGKQSQLLSPKFGPWLFLAELITDLELDSDSPNLGNCGDCTICIEECPTDAIRPGSQIDARRCIAYLTIEHKTEITDELKSLIGDWVFGCDICLQVCPYAKKGKETSWMELKKESGFGPEMNLLDLLEIKSNRAYEKKFEGTAIMRARRKQLQRNATVVLQNNPSP